MNDQHIFIYFGGRATLSCYNFKKIHFTSLLTFSITINYIIRFGLKIKSIFSEFNSRKKWCEYKKIIFIGILILKFYGLLSEIYCLDLKDVINIQIKQS